MSRIIKTLDITFIFVHKGQCLTFQKWFSLTYMLHCVRLEATLNQAGSDGGGCGGGGVCLCVCVCLNAVVCFVLSVADLGSRRSLGA